MRSALILTVLCAMLTGCSSFHKQWKSALQQPLPTGDISGPWEGRWVSSKNGHNGRLRCVMTQTGTNSYNAHFHATFWKVFRAAYEVPFAVTNINGQFVFSGTSNLGKLAGGVYSYEGTARPAEFRASYDSNYDHGRFEMSRPLPK